MFFEMIFCGAKTEPVLKKQCIYGQKPEGAFLEWFVFSQTRFDIASNGSREYREYCNYLAKNMRLWAP
jgi:hypothetical protein